MTERKTYGLDIERERAAQDGTEDIYVGGESPECIATIPQEKREEYLPEGEVQRTDKDDLMDCATRVVENILETKLTYLLRNKLLKPANEAFLRDNGYVVSKPFSECVVLADAFNAILSHTTRAGNSLKEPLHSVHEDGVIPKAMLPLEFWMSFDDYHDPKRITGKMTRLGKEFAARFPFRYEKVFEKDYGELIEKDMLDVAGYAWPEQNAEGWYVRSEEPVNHAFAFIRKIPLLNGHPFLKRIFDNYIADQTFLKDLANDYDMLDYGYRIYIISE